MCGIPLDVVDRALLDENADMVLILVRAAHCSWTTAKAVLLMQAADRGIAAHDLDRALRSFQRLGRDTPPPGVEFYHPQSPAEPAAATRARDGTGPAPMAVEENRRAPPA